MAHTAHVYVYVCGPLGGLSSQLQKIIPVTEQIMSRIFYGHCLHLKDQEIDLPNVIYNEYKPSRAV